MDKKLSLFFVIFYINKKYSNVQFCHAMSWQYTVGFDDQYKTNFSDVPIRQNKKKQYCLKLYSYTENITGGGRMNVY